MYLTTDVEWINRTNIFDEVGVLEKFQLTRREIEEQDLMSVIEALKDIDEKKAARFNSFKPEKYLN